MQSQNLILFLKFCYSDLFWEVVGLERGPLSRVRLTEELRERNVAAAVYKTEITAVALRCADQATPSIR
jgi:hypothetical protein